MEMLLPNLCLNLPWPTSRKESPGDAYRWTLNALKYVQLTDNSHYKKGMVESSLLAISSQFGLQEAGLHLEGVADPGDLPPALQIAMVFKEHGEEQYAREIIEREYAKDPGDPRLKAEIDNLQKEDARNLAQKKKWNYFQKYVRNPFSRFNFDMAVAFLVQEKHLPKFFQDIGERRLDAALEISPDSRDAWLLKGWYCYNLDDAGTRGGSGQKSPRRRSGKLERMAGAGILPRQGRRFCRLCRGFRKSNRTLSGLSAANCRRRFVQAIEAGKTDRIRLEPLMKSVIAPTYSISMENRVNCSGRQALFVMI